MFRREERPVSCGSVSAFNGVDTIRGSQQLEYGHSSHIIGHSVLRVTGSIVNGHIFSIGHFRFTVKVSVF
jgi:hypothetical protein